MMHYTRVHGFTDLPTEAAEGWHGPARDVGRPGSAFAVAVRDQNPLVYGPSEPFLATGLPAAIRPRDRTAFHAERPLSARRKYLAPGRRGGRRAGGRARCSTCNTDRKRCSGGAATRCWKRSLARRRKTGRRIHMHFLENAISARLGPTLTFPGGIVQHLDSIGLLFATPEPHPLRLGAARRTRNCWRAARVSPSLTTIAPTSICVPAWRRLPACLSAAAVWRSENRRGERSTMTTMFLREFRLAHLLHVGDRLQGGDQPRTGFWEWHSAMVGLSVTNIDDGGVIAAGRAGRSAVVGLGGARQRSSARGCRCVGAFLFAPRHRAPH